MSKRKKISYILAVCFLILPMCSLCVYGEENKEQGSKKPENLYSGACVLMDGSSGRVLFEKNGKAIMPMASTTKIMTLIVALENCNPEETVTVSAYAASQPKVHLGMHSGQQFLLRDLFYSLMLESHNDSAVAIAEHIGSKKLKLPDAGVRTKEESKKAIAAFTDMMNEKARDIGCFDTYFITPNGLDAQVLLDDGTQKFHSTTASDLALIMSYCVHVSMQKDTFLSITQASSHAFSDIEKKSSYNCANHNAFLGMMEGALSGKTGFTNQAGYCYVGALYRDNKLLIVSLLACGWPNHKSYKWSDTKKLMEYGLSNYTYRQVYEKKEDFEKIKVTNANSNMEGVDYVSPYMDEEELEVLLKEEEKVTVTYELPKKLTAPIEKGEVLGNATYALSGDVIAVYPVMADKSVDKKTFSWCFIKVIEMFIG